LDINLPGFVADTTPSSDMIFAFETVSRRIDAGFTEKLPERNPEYEKLGCYTDVLTDRAIGGGKWSVYVCVCGSDKQWC
jgi:hypothetical protein